MASFANTSRYPLSLVCGALGVGFLGGVIGAAVVREGGNARVVGQQTAPHAAQSSAPNARVATGDPVVDVVERTSPAVVSIIVTKDLPKLDDVLVDPFADPFFGGSPFRFRVRRPSSDVEPREVGGGTGFIVSADGMILTNRHVVSDPDASYTALFNTGEKVSARLLAQDPTFDLAVLKVEKQGLPTIPLGDARGLRVGQTVIAIGNALGEFRNTVSVGVISGLGRHVTAGNQSTGQSESLDAVIQTDAAINPGNSGGPLLNLQGEAIGMNTAVAGGAENIGFALPIDEGARVLEDVRTRGRILRAFLGVRYVLITKALARANDLPVDYGALVVAGEQRAESAVAAGSAAARAGIQEKDILLEFDGQRIDADHSLASLIRGKRPNDRVKFKVLSDGTEKTVAVTLGEAK